MLVILVQRKRGHGYNPWKLRTLLRQCCSDLINITYSKKEECHKKVVRFFGIHLEGKFLGTPLHTKLHVCLCEQTHLKLMVKICIVIKIKFYCERSEQKIFAFNSVTSIWINLGALNIACPPLSDMGGMWGACAPRPPAPPLMKFGVLQIDSQ